eukprot:1988056-Pyramimonas_sp.AAC.1
MSLFSAMARNKTMITVSRRTWPPLVHEVGHERVPHRGRQVNPPRASVRARWRGPSTTVPP